MDATLLAWLSNPVGKMILAESVLICFHFKEGGFPPNCWHTEMNGTSRKIQGPTSFRMALDICWKIMKIGCTLHGYGINL